MLETKNAYPESELKEFKEIILKKKKRAEEDLALLQAAYRNDSDNGTDDTSPSFKYFDESNDHLNKEANVKLAIRQEKFISDLENALLRMKNKTYGKCFVTGKLIQKERLKLVPHATMSIEAKRAQ